MKHKQLTVLPLAVFLSAVGIGSTLAGTMDKAYTDDQLQLLVEHDLSRKGIENIQVKVSDGMVTLSGRAESTWAKREAVAVATKVRGVKNVSDGLTIEKPASDEDLAARLKGKIANYVLYTIYDEVGLSVENGVVTLTGRVTTPYKASEIADFVSRERGVQEVKSEVQTLPLSPLDDQLRATLAAAIYRDLPEYATRRDGPIHIIVENGRVTLFGTVRTDVERRVIEHTARSTFGVMSVDNRLEAGS